MADVRAVVTYVFYIVTRKQVFIRFLLYSSVLEHPFSFEKKTCPFVAAINVSTSFLFPTVPITLSMLLFSTFLFYSILFRLHSIFFGFFYSILFSFILFFLLTYCDFPKQWWRVHSSPTAGGISYGSRKTFIPRDCRLTCLYEMFVIRLT